MTMRWDRLVSAMQCPREQGMAARVRPADAFRSAFEADFDRIIYSTPFRRLARKTQVHPLALNDHVHTRLTHSLEVASVGRSLTKRLVSFLEKRGELPKGVEGTDLTWIVQAACLAHDLGNPPFGHAGEYAIREWVRTHPNEVFGEMEVGEGVRADWEVFEGNAQGFRMGARADNSKTGYLRLTFGTLGAMVKYPWDSQDARAKATGKFNVFSTEKWVFELVAEETGMRRGDGSVARHPLSFLSEAADDICYRILDLEDAAELGILDEERVRGIYMKIVDGASKEWALSLLRGQAIQSLINGMWEVFEMDYAGIMEGERERDLKADLRPGLKEAMEEIKKVYGEIFADRTKVAAELGAYKALGRIIKALCAATRQFAVKKKYADCGFLAKRCGELAWGEKYVVAHEGETYEWWLHQVMDYVAALTDNYARQLSREIEGT